MQGIPTDEAKRLLLDMMDDFGAYCDAHGYRYVLDYGSLIGAVRHHGFIPWDDDLDIMMPRADFEAAMHGYRSSHPWYRAVCPSNEQGMSWDSCGGKIYDLRTISRKDVHHPMPLAIDVMPVDLLPDNLDLRFFKARVLDLLRWALWGASTPFGMSTHFVDKTSELGSANWRYYLRSLQKNIIIALFRWTPARFWRQLADRVTRWPVENKKGAMDCLLTEHIARTPVTEEFFNRRWRVPFEDRSYWIPSAYDRYLAETYGNYMLLPPPDSRIGHHMTEFVWSDDATRKKED